jgi:hypothetical protein
MSAPQITAGRVTGTRDQRAATDAAWQPIAPTVRALARIEGPRLLRHPAFVAGAVLSVFFSIMMVTDNVGGAYQLLMGTAIVPLAAGTLLAANLAALRNLRSDTVELQGPLPARPLATTLAHLLSIAWATAAAILFVTVAFVLIGAADGVEVDVVGRTAVPSAFELAQGPAAVTVAGAAGVALARMVPQLVASSLAVVVLLAGDMMLSSQSRETALAWFAPVVNTADVAPDTEWPCYRPEERGCEVLGFHHVSAGWHLLYLAGVAGVLVAFALIRDHERRLARRIGVAGLLTVVVAGVLQIP